MRRDKTIDFRQHSTKRIVMDYSIIYWFFDDGLPGSDAYPSGCRHSSNNSDCISGKTWGKTCSHQIHQKKGKTKLLLTIELHIICSIQPTHTKQIQHNVYTQRRIIANSLGALFTIKNINTRMPKLQENWQIIDAHVTGSGSAISCHVPLSDRNPPVKTFSPSSVTHNITFEKAPAICLFDWSLLQMIHHRTRKIHRINIRRNDL